MGPGAGNILVGGRILSLDPPLVMGVLNVTPDSFSDGGLYLEAGAAEEHAHRMVGEGAAIVDVGGESTRPGSAEIPVEDELARVLPVVSRLARSLRVPVSVDTRRLEVARRAVDAGASIVNDVSGLTGPPAIDRGLAASGAAFVLMHRRAASRDMYGSARYGDVAAEVRVELGAIVGRALELGVPRDRVLVDPGIGFSKRAEHSIELLARLDEIARLGHPIVVGPSRKSFIPRAAAWAAAGATGPWPDEVATRGEQMRLGGTAAAVAAAVLGGAHVIRVHDVAVMRETALVARAIRARVRPGEGVAP